MTIRIPTKNWQRAKPNTSKAIHIKRGKRERFVSPSRASGLTKASTRKKSPSA